jgi:hypothetical protein
LSPQKGDICARNLPEAAPNFSRGSAATAYPTPGVVKGGCPGSRHPGGVVPRPSLGSAPAVNGSQRPAVPLLNELHQREGAALGHRPRCLPRPRVPGELHRRSCHHRIRIPGDGCQGLGDRGPCCRLTATWLKTTRRGCRLPTRSSKTLRSCGCVPLHTDDGAAVVARTPGHNGSLGAGAPDEYDQNLEALTP